MQTRFDFKRIELLDNAIRPLGELFVIIGTPPHNEISVSVEARALIVEAVGHLMTNDRADASIIECLVRFRIVEGRLENAGGKNDLVELRIVISVDRRRRHAPFGFVNGLADLAEVTLEIKLTCRDR